MPGIGKAKAAAQTDQSFIRPSAKKKKRGRTAAAAHFALSLHNFTHGTAGGLTPPRRRSGETQTEKKQPNNSFLI